MLDLIKKKAKILREREPKEFRTEFTKNFFADDNHLWISENKIMRRSFEILLESLSDAHLIFFKKHPTFFIPCQAHLSCAIGKTNQSHLILVFPELIQLLKSASAFHGIAILAHELGHIFHQHTENKTDVLTAQIEADEFAVCLGFGEELHDVLSEHSNLSDCKIRLAKISEKIHGK